MRVRGAKAECQSWNAHRIVDAAFAHQGVDARIAAPAQNGPPSSTEPVRQTLGLEDARRRDDECKCDKGDPVAVRKFQAVSNTE
jgi:hypothetical protein